MANDHFVRVPKAFWGLKIAQTVLAVIVFALACYVVAILGTTYAGFTVFAGLFTIGALVYYFVAVHSQHHAYNWIALLVLECVAVIFWLVVWALFATWVAAAVYYSNADYYYTKRSALTKRLTYGELDAAGAMVYAILALGLIEWVLYCVTLGLFAAGVHKHRKASRPMNANGHTLSSWDSAPKEEKHDMQPIPAAVPQYSHYEPTPAHQQGSHSPPAAGIYSSQYNTVEAPTTRY